MVLPELQFGSTKEAFEVIRCCIENMAPGRYACFNTQVSNRAPEKAEAYAAVLFVVNQYFPDYPVRLVRFGRGVRQLNLLKYFGGSVVMYWMSGSTYE